MVQVNVDVDQEINEMFLDEVRHMLHWRMIRNLMDWGLERGFCFHMAAISAANGRWDDIKRDLDRERITLAEAVEIIDKCLAFGLINQTQWAFYKQTCTSLCS